MELDPTTFALQILNFLVLLWLLNRFLFRPMRSALQRRAEAAAAQQQSLAAERAQLQAHEAELKRRDAQQEAQRREAEHALEQALAKEREQRLAALHGELASERQKALARWSQEQRQAQALNDRQLHRRAAAFVTTYLQRLATPAVEASVVELFLADLAAQSQAACAALCAEGPGAGEGEGGEGAARVDVATAFEPAPALRERVDQQLRSLMGDSVRTRWQRDPALLAGICVHLPGHQLEASLRRGIDAFAAQSP